MSPQQLFKFVLLLFLLHTPCRVYPRVGQQIPQGVDRQVDETWNVIPQKIVKDNFGGRVVEKYYAVEIVVGNSTGHDLIIEAIEFTPPAYAGSSQSTSLPVASAPFVSAYISNPAQLRRFYETSFRAPLVIRNNTQVRTIVFAPRPS